MSYNNMFLFRKGTKSLRPDSGGAIAKTVPVFGVVKDNIDPIRSGRIRVYIAGFSGNNPDDSSSWIPVSYMANFYGHTSPTGGSEKDNYGNPIANPSSYGMWFSPPDIGTEVICIFVNGDPNYGFYIGAVPKPEALRMVPAIGANFSDQSEKVIFNEREATSYGGALRVPVTNMNVNNEQISDSVDFLTSSKPVHSYSAYVMFQQGVIRDPIRGPIGSSSQRESPSRVGWGVSTPGRPIYEGGLSDAEVTTTNSAKGTKIISRRGGHSIVMDDGDIIGNDQLIRIRTALGHQILMSDNGQTLMILHSNGQSYIELGKEGTIDLYSTNSVNIRTQGDLNLHADNNVNIHANKNINMYSGENTNIESTKDFTQKVGGLSKLYTVGNYTLKIDGSYSLQSSGDAGIASSGKTFINGSRINFNTGSIGLTPEAVQSIKKFAQTDTLYDSQRGYIASPGKLQTIVSRAPAHCPWANAGQGVDVKTNLNAAAEFPVSPSSSIQAINAIAGPVSPAQAVTPASMATVPSTAGISKSIDATSTGALISAQAQLAKTGPAASAVAQGAGVVTENGVTKAVIGATALEPKNLEVSGYTKPGTAAMTESLIQGGSTLEQAMPPSVFTGKDGVDNLESLKNNVNAQVAATANNLQVTQKQLTNAGIISGNEDASAIGGVLLAGATQGVGATTEAIKSVGDSVGAAAVSSPGNTPSSIFQAISSGNFASKESQFGINAFARIKELAIARFSSAYDSTKNAAYSAFEAVKKALKPFEANKPQDLLAIAESNKATEVLDSTAKTFSNNALTKTLSSVIGSVGNPLISIAKSTGADTISSFNLISKNFDVSNITKTAAEQLNTTTNSIGTSLKSGATSLVADTVPTIGTLSKYISSASSVASGVNNLPGGERAIAAINSNQVTSSDSLGTQLVKNLVDNKTTASFNDISSSAAAQSTLTVGSSISSQFGAIDQTIQQTMQGVTQNLNRDLSQTASLTDLSKNNLFAQANEALQSQIAAVSSIGGTLISLPSSATKTTDRNIVESAARDLLGDSRIPVPNFSGEIDESVTSVISEQAKQRQETIQKIRTAKINLDEQIDKVKIIKDKISTLENSLPEGDQNLLTLKQELQNELKVENELYKQYVASRITESFEG